MVREFVGTLSPWVGLPDEEKLLGSCSQGFLVVACVAQLGQTSRKISPSLPCGLT